MQTRVYGIYGQMTAVVRVPVNKSGRAYLELEFTRGCPHNRANYRPATYATSDKTEQDIIENSPLFGTQIKLVRVHGTPDPVKVKVKKVQAPEQQEIPRRTAHRVDPVVIGSDAAPALQKDEQGGYTQMQGAGSTAADAAAAGLVEGIDPAPKDGPVDDATDAGNDDETKEPADGTQDAADNTDADGFKDYPEVTDITAARAVLKGLGVKAVALRSYDGVRSAMQHRKVKFSNFQF